MNTAEDVKRHVQRVWDGFCKAPERIKSVDGRKRAKMAAIEAETGDQIMVKNFLALVLYIRYYYRYNKFSPPDFRGFDFMIFAKHGFVRTYNRRRKNRWRYRGSAEEVFTRIYKRNLWNSKESRSGPGSELQATKNLRHALPGLIKQYSVDRFLDVPCGDFNWMQHVLPGLHVDYIGGDIVAPLIMNNQNKWGGG
ncbi:MAG: hypothetical protein OXD29_10625 [Roseovarius sp.]|nr:hypothetical protein [Roseovarius sp.]